VECWGRNDYGQVGDNTDVDKLTPTQVLTGVGPTTTTTTTTTEPETTTTIAVATTVVSASELPETGSQSDGWIIAAIIAMISGTVLVTRRRNLS
jgi:LPXTG-motif cell wall-anchored protein